MSEPIPPHAGPSTPQDVLDVMAPWGAGGPPPSDSWRTDLLGEAFESRTLPLLPDDEGECVATLVRYLPRLDPLAPTSALGIPRFHTLYVHGRNDYFFQTELARTVAAAGGLFHALDLRKYGRSLRPHQTIGYVDDLRTYDEDLSEAFDLIHAEHGRLPLVLIGHSTGGLITTLWAHRHPGAVAGLVLNSAWLEMQAMASMRPAMQQLIGRIADRRPLWSVPVGGSNDFYGRSLAEGWASSGLPLPERLRGHEDDPAVRGWEYAREWKRRGSYPVPARWLEAIMAGHEVVEKEVHLTCPVLSLCAQRSFEGEEWGPDVFSTDVVLDVEAITERSARLADVVTIARFPGRHDLFLSDPDVRARVWDVMGRWLETAL